MKNQILLFLLIPFLLLTGCKNEETKSVADAEVYYTCPMHTTVIKSTPGSCPVCNMTLIKVEKKNTDHSTHKGNYIVLDRNQQLLAGIKTDTVKLIIMQLGTPITGTVTINEQQVSTLTSRAAGRIDKLFVKSTGIFIKSGAPIYSIYSEQLQADQNEYIALRKQLSISGSSQISSDLLNGSKNKLRLWGFTPNQISQLGKTGRANAMVTFYASQSGYVSDLKVTEGMYVNEGTQILKISPLQKVWVEAQLYSNELSSIQNNKSYQVVSEDNPNDVYDGKLVYSNPVIEEGKRIHLLRIEVDNSNGKLIPGMLVSVTPNNNKQKVLAVPKSALLLEKMKTVWIVSSEDTFDQRMVETGIENNNWIEIKSGIKPGDVVVTQGAYLISSEFILKSGAGQRHDH